MPRDYPDTFAPEPVDRVAGRVIASGVHHEFKKQHNNREVWDAPPPVVPACYVPDTVQPLIGQRKGALVVVGYLGQRVNPSGSKRKQILLVRCDCGKYEERVAQRWRRHDSYGSQCQFCERREALKLAHLPDSDKDRVVNAARKRQGLLTKDELAQRKRERADAHWKNDLLKRLQRSL